MLYLILGDIHGNLAAFEAVLAEARKEGAFDKLICLGDIVGYGPEPHECIQLIQAQNNSCVAGNHDRAVSGKISVNGFNSQAAEAINWTAGRLTATDLDYLNSLPEKTVFAEFTCTHGSPRDPISEYLLSAISAEDNFPYFDTDICLVGHTHIPLIFENSHEGALLHEFRDGDVFPIGGNQVIINPGGVGQPRDNDPRAAYAIYDTDKNAVFARRVEYDIAATQMKMREAGLPDFLINRLSYGY